MRLFIAILFEKHVLDALTGFQQDLKKIGMRGNYTREENLHLTLAFIGEYGNPDEVLDAMERVSFRAFDLCTDGYGCFGDLFWVGISGGDELSGVVSRLRRELSDAKIPFDKKKFKPHITLIRKASCKVDRSIPISHISDCGMTVKRISLMKSERGKKGMIYTEIGGVDCEPE